MEHFLVPSFQLADVEIAIGMSQEYSDKLALGSPPDLDRVCLHFFVRDVLSRLTYFRSEKEDIFRLLNEYWFGSNSQNRVVIRTKHSNDVGRDSHYNFILQAYILQLIHEVFGGELLIDEFLCFKDHCQLVSSFDAGQNGEVIPVSSDMEVFLDIC